MIQLSLPLFPHKYLNHTVLILTFPNVFACFFCFFLCFHLASSFHRLPNPPPHPTPTPTSLQSCLLHLRLSCDKDGTCSQSSSCYASCSAALIFWHWSPSNCQQQTGTEGWQWMEILGEAGTFFVINNFPLTNMKQDFLLIFYFFSFGERKLRWMMPPVCWFLSERQGKGEPIALHGPE